ncbi:hypothetical protein [Sinomonas gamaensis]|uniref:hypothetical protein n=1 Tax=Sinomonas gamaensis TaxID=2565624 RepID=UPI00110961E5|nr:hypothetical protein [Sinomonas gamaensis]
MPRPVVLSEQDLPHQILVVDLAQRLEGVRDVHDAAEKFDHSEHVAESEVRVVSHPADPGVLLGAAPAALRDDYDAVVSLGRMGTACPCPHRKTTLSSG